MPAKRKTAKSKSKNRKNASSEKMEIVKVVAKNGRVMYFRVIDGKKKRISKDAALEEGNEIQSQPKSKAKKAPATKAKKAAKASKTKKLSKTKPEKPEKSETSFVSFTKEFIAKSNEKIKKAVKDPKVEADLRIEGLFNSREEERRFAPKGERSFAVLEKKRTSSKELRYSATAYLYLYLGYEFKPRSYAHFYYTDIITDDQIKETYMERAKLMASLGYNYPLVRYEITLPDQSIVSLNYLRSSTEEERYAFLGKLYDNPEYIKHVLDVYSNLAKHGYTFTEGATFIGTCFIMDDGSLGLNRHPNPTKNNEMGFKDLFARTLQWVGNDYAREQDKEVEEATQKQFQLGTYILEWIRDNKPKMLKFNGEGLNHFSYQANQDHEAWSRLDMNEVIDLKKWKAFEKIVMAKKTLKWY